MDGVAELRRLAEAIGWREDGEDCLDSIVEASGLSPVEFQRLGAVFGRVLQRRGGLVLKKGATLRCSFCLKTQREVRTLVGAPNANICDEWVETSGAVVRRELATRDE